MLISYNKTSGPPLGSSPSASVTSEVEAADPVPKVNFGTRTSTTRRPPRPVTRTSIQNTDTGRTTTTRPLPPSTSARTTTSTTTTTAASTPVPVAQIFDTSGDDVLNNFSLVVWKQFREFHSNGAKLEHIYIAQ